MPINNHKCPFCEIIARNDLDVHEIFRDANVIAIFPTEPAVLGHILLIPRRHVPDVWHLTPEEATQLSRIILYLASAIRVALSPEGLNIIQSNGEVATQSVFHLHVHLVPRWAGDAMGSIWPAKTNFSDSQKEEAFQKIHNAVKQINKPIPSVTPEDRRKHLDYIQAVINRQSAASSSTKGWLLPIVTATFGFALTQNSWPLAVIGLVAILLFAYLDANYLRSEKRFRTLYNTVAQSRRLVPNFTLDPADAEEPSGDVSAQSRWQTFAHSYFPEWKIWRSWSILPFYFALFALGVVMVVTIVLRGV